MASKRDQIMTRDILFDDAARMEREGANAGLNPMFGEWQQSFGFAPVPYGDGGTKRQAFREAIQNQFANAWLYSHEVQVEITLHLNVQTVLETSETADLDNYAKAILDGLKGPNGIMFDDTQVQALGISWIDEYREPSFTVQVRGAPDDFVLKPIEFYEMSDGLWYPHGRNAWTDGKAEALDDRQHYAGLLIIEMMTSVKKRARAELRKVGHDRLHAYQRSKYVSLLARGFHRSRVADSGFRLHSRREWQEAYRGWKKGNPQDIETVENLIAQSKTTYDAMIELLSGRLPSGVAQTGPAGSD